MVILLLFFFISLTLSERFTIKLPPNITVSSFEKLYGLQHVKHVLGYDIFKATHNTRKRSLVRVEGLVAELPKQKFTRFGTDDPLYAMQWHSHGNPHGVLTTDQYSGLGVNIAIVDDGVEFHHPDLLNNYQSALSWNYNDNNADPTPNNGAGHGTCCAGLAGAVKNTVCGRGIAYNAGIVGIKILGRGVYDFEEAQALSHRNDQIRIYSNSWGPYDDGRRLEGPGMVTKTALERGFNSGRNIFVWAGGNGKAHQDNSNYDGYANSPYTIAIGANNHLGGQSYYSESGANIFATAPSSGAGKGLITTDLQGPAGYSHGSCAYDFGGTSGAAPIAAGVIALMLEEKPELTQRDVMHIIAKSGNYLHTHERGFGTLNVPRIMKITKKHKLVPTMKKMKKVKTVNMEIPKGYDWLSVPIQVPYAMNFIEQVLITIRMTHGHRGQVLIQLESPVAESILAEHRADHHSGHSEWTYSSVHHWKEKANIGDTWKLKIRDDTYNTYHGQLETVSIEWWGY